MEREELTCNDLRYNNFKVFELCGYKAVMKKLEKKYSVHHKKRKIGKKTLIRANANKYAHNKLDK